MGCSGHDRRGGDRKQLELIRWQAWLEYIPEHSLSKKPLAADLLVIKKGRTLESVLNVISKANKKTFEQLYGEEGSMLRGGLYEIFKPEIDKAAKEAAEEAAKEAALAAEKAVAKKLEAAETRNREDRRIILEKLESGDVEGALAFLRQ